MNYKSHSTAAEHLRNKLRGTHRVLLKNYDIDLTHGDGYSTVNLTCKKSKPAKRINDSPKTISHLVHDQ
jgi:hypothetical protein